MFDVVLKSRSFKPFKKKKKHFGFWSHVWSIFAIEKKLTSFILIYVNDAADNMLSM